MRAVIGPRLESTEIFGWAVCRRPTPGLKPGRWGEARVAAHPSASLERVVLAGEGVLAREGVLHAGERVLAGEGVILAGELVVLVGDRVLGELKNVFRSIDLGEAEALVLHVRWVPRPVSHQVPPPLREHVLGQRCFTHVRVEEADWTSEFLVEPDGVIRRDLRLRLREKRVV